MSDISTTHMEKVDSSRSIRQGLSPSEISRRDAHEAQVRRVASEYIQAAEEYQRKDINRGWPNYKMNEEAYKVVMRHIESLIKYDSQADSTYREIALTQLEKELKALRFEEYMLATSDEGKGCAEQTDVQTRPRDKLIQIADAFIAAKDSTLLKNNRELHDELKQQPLNNDTEYPIITGYIKNQSGLTTSETYRICGYVSRQTLDTKEVENVYRASYSKSAPGVPGEMTLNFGNPAD